MFPLSCALLTFSVAALQGRRVAVEAHVCRHAGDRWGAERPGCRRDAMLGHGLGSCIVEEESFALER
jgi:hypothetical protein